jgi:hypothetical protein
MSLCEILERFNRKERNLVIRHILGHTANPLRLDVKFRYKVSTALNLESQIPESISWWTDYHISWLAGALVLFAMGPEVASKASPTGSGILENRQLSNHRWLVEGGGEDIDLVLAYDHELILIEAKGDAFFSNKQLKSKIERLELVRQIYHEKSPGMPEINFRFALMSPQPPTPKRLTVTWPEWALRGAKLPAWIELPLPTNLLMVSRCNESSGERSRDGECWAVCPAGHSSPRG